MIAITQEGNEYKMKFSWPGTGYRGFSVYAYDIDEIHEAIDHHYLHGDHRAGTRIEECPLCREMED